MGCGPLVVCSIGSALLYTAPPELMAGRLPSTSEPCVWRVGDRVRIDEALSQWLQLGYRHEPVVESPGAFSHRGGILDIFPPDCELPLRIELFDDEIDTIRRLDPLTQRSVGAADEVWPIPAREQLPGMAGPDTLASRADAMDFSRCGVEVRERIGGGTGNSGLLRQHGSPLLLQRAGEPRLPAGLPGPFGKLRGSIRAAGTGRARRGGSVGAGRAPRADADGSGRPGRAASKFPIALCCLDRIRRPARPVPAP